MNLKLWAKGLLAAFVAGTGQGLAALAVGVMPKKALLLVLVSGLIGAGLYLKQSPLP